MGLGSRMRRWFSVEGSDRVHGRVADPAVSADSAAILDPAVEAGPDVSPFAGWTGVGAEPDGEGADPSTEPAGDRLPATQPSTDAAVAPDAEPLLPSLTKNVARALVVGDGPAQISTRLPTWYGEVPAEAMDPAEERALVREAWEWVSDRSDALVLEFYAELFVRMPDAMLMFPSSMVRQRHEFGHALVQWVVADTPRSMMAHLEQLGSDHRKFDVTPEHYEVVGVALTATWKRFAGKDWTDRHEVAVRTSYSRLATIMIDGALRARQEPAWWGARVVSHERVSPDFAVLRVQPDAPYPFKPGQYLTLEMSSHRRQWRQMSIASAPRGDNTFDLQVRAVGGSGVSAALVMHTQPGDRLRLGPPRGGNLVIDRGAAPNGLLCISSGTGSAPMTAVIEAVLEWPQPPPVLYAYLGARTRDDAYAVMYLEKLVHAMGSSLWAHVHGVLSDEPEYGGFSGRVEAVVPSLRDWAELGVEVLIAGPNAMIASTVASLVGQGVSASRIHFDQYESRS